MGQKEIGIVGLGKMGSGLARQALEKGYRVVGKAHHEVPDELQKAGVDPADDHPALVQKMQPPRVLLLYVPPGQVVDKVLDRLLDVLEEGDVVVDGGNSYWGDTLRRAARAKEAGVHLVDAGTSGGPSGARHGACFMVGGDADAVAIVEPLLRPLALDGGFVHAGGPGTGHYVKLVHNGILYGMLQAIGEGVALLHGFDAQQDHLDIPATLEAWRHGTVIRSVLVDQAAKAYQEHPGLEDVPGHVEDTGEADWLVSDAMRLEVPAPVLAQSVMALKAARSGGDATKMVAVMRQAFGGHPLGHDAAQHEERRTGRVGDFPRP